LRVQASGSELLQLIDGLFSTAEASPAWKIVRWAPGFA